MSDDAYPEECSSSVNQFEALHILVAVAAVQTFPTKMSEALVWQVLSKSNSKSFRRTHPISKMTYEKGTLTNRRIQSDSGFCRAKAVDVSANDDGIPVISLKNANPDELRNPDKMWKTVTLSGGVRKALAKTESLLDTYSPAAKKPAMRKVSAIYKAYARKNMGIDHTTLITSQ